MAETNVGFSALARAQAAHLVGDAAVAIALADTLFFSPPIDEARCRVGLYLAITMTPFAVLSPLVAPWLDRRGGTWRAAIIVTDLVRMVLAGLLAMHHAGIAVYPLAFGLLVLSRTHAVSRNALVPHVAAPGQSLVRRNARLAVVSAVSGALGGGIALGFAVLVGTAGTLSFAAAVFAAGAFVATGLPGVAAAPSVGEPETATSGRLPTVAVGMATTRWIVGFLSLSLAFSFHSQGSPSAQVLVVVAAAGVGGFVGPALASRTHDVVGEGVLLLVALLAMVLAGVAAVAVRGYPAAILLAAIVAIGAGAARGRLRQRRAAGRSPGCANARLRQVRDAVPAVVDHRRRRRHREHGERRDGGGCGRGGRRVRSARLDGRRVPTRSAVDLTAIELHRHGWLLPPRVVRASRTRAAGPAVRRARP